MNPVENLKASLVSAWVRWSPYAENTINFITILASYERG
jgi:hypothetical protein